MVSIPRPLVTAALRSSLEAPGPRLVVVSGAQGSGRRRLLRRGIDDLRREGRWEVDPVWVRFDPAPPSHLRRQLRHEFSDATPDADDERSAGSPLPEVVARLESDRRTRLLVLDEPHHLLRADPEAGEELAEMWQAVRARALPLHLVVVADDDASLAPWIGGSGVALTDVDTVRVSPLGPHELRRWLTGWSPRERFLLWCAVGGRPDRLRHVDPDGDLASNVQSLVLDPEGPLHRIVPDQLLSQLQKAERYVGVLAALAAGASEWGEIRRRVPELSDGSRLAPYLAALEERGWVDVGRSLDARPESRQRRYTLTDPAMGFWLLAVAPAQGRLHLSPPRPVWDSEIRGRLELWGSRCLGRAVCEALLNEEESPALRVPARRVGGLWGDGYDVPVAGILSNGASFYGHSVWGRAPTGADVDTLEAEVRRTRFGFGRETRLRLIVSEVRSGEALVRRAARDAHLRVLNLADLF